MILVGIDLKTKLPIFSVSGLDRPEDTSEVIYIETLEGVDVLSVLSEYYYDGANLVFRGSQPSLNYQWDSNTSLWVYDLSLSKLSLVDKFNSLCQSAIYEGFTSNALGSLHNYPLKQTDQINLVASVTDSYNPENSEDWTTSFWCVDSLGNWDYRLHNKAQIQRVGSDGKMHITTQIKTNAILQAQIQQATTKEELEAITW